MIVISRPVVTMDATHAIDDPALLVFARGTQSMSGGAVMLTSDSVQTMIVVLQDGEARGLAFQNTRRHPITDVGAASIWREFDSLWNCRNAKSDE